MNVALGLQGGVLLLRERRGLQNAPTLSKRHLFNSFTRKKCPKLWNVFVESRQKKSRFGFFPFSLIYLAD